MPRPQWADVVPVWGSSSDVLALMKSRGAAAAVSTVQAGAYSGTCLIHGCQGAAHSVLGASAITAQSYMAAQTQEQLCPMSEQGGEERFLSAPL